MNRGIFLSLVILVLAISTRGIELPDREPRPHYDHQVATYTVQFKPFQVNAASIGLTPFFAPDFSLEKLVEVIENAKRKINISTPSISSWNGCSYPQSGETCIGCTAEKLIQSESFPIFQALNNALHRGIEVNIMTNDFNDQICEGRLDLLGYLQHAGAHVRFFRSLTFTHSKYMDIDDEIIVISSINWTRASITTNREAGIIIRENPYTTFASETSLSSGINATHASSDPQLLGFTSRVFMSDFKTGYEKEIPRISERDAQMIRDANHIPVVFPTPRTFACNATSVTPTEIIGPAKVGILASPDYALPTILEDLMSPSESLFISIYQITDVDICNSLIHLKKSNPRLNLRIFVSDDIYGPEDKAEALVCYNRLFKEGVVVRRSHPKCLKYSHQKFWIIDGRVLYMSTGNLSPTDFPGPPLVFPPYGSEGWRKTNRNYTVRIESKAVIDRFMAVYENDYRQGFDHSPQ